MLSTKSQNMMSQKRWHQVINKFWALAISCQRVKSRKQMVFNWWGRLWNWSHKWNTFDWCEPRLPWQAIPQQLGPGGNPNEGRLVPHALLQSDPPLWLLLIVHAPRLHCCGYNGPSNRSLTCRQHEALHAWRHPLSIRRTIRRHLLQRI